MIICYSTPLIHSIHSSDLIQHMKASMTPDSYREGRNLVKFFTLSESTKVKGIPKAFSKVKLHYDLDTGRCHVTPLSEDDSFDQENDFTASFLVDRHDYALTSLRADKYVLEEFIDRARNVSVSNESSIDFDDF